MTYFAYVHRSGSLVVRKLQSPIQIQEAKTITRELVSSGFEAPDIERARAIANQLRRISA